MVELEARPAVGNDTRVFISYSRTDLPFADRLRQALNNAGFEAYLDKHDILPGEPWQERLGKLIESADVVVFALSPASIASRMCDWEVNEAERLSKRIVPVVCAPTEDADIPGRLMRLNFVFLRDETEWQSEFAILVKALLTDIAWMRAHTDHIKRALRWVEQGRPSNQFLLTGIEIEQAQSWLAQRPAKEDIPEVFIDYLRASVKKEDQDRRELLARMRTKQRMQAFAGVLLVGIIAGLVGWINQAYIMNQWRWFAITRPFMVEHVRPHVLTAAAERLLKAKDGFRECASKDEKDYCPEMVVVPAGSYMMGSSPVEKGRDPNEEPQHQVTIARPFAVSKFQLTFEEWDICVAYGDCSPRISDSGFGRGQRPVINVSWDDAQRYISWLSRMTGKPYRLLTEAEYEYATRAGTQTVYHWGDDIGKNNANCMDCGSDWDNKQTAPVGSFAPNAFGLYDMAGNVFSWTEDCWHNDYRGAPTDGSAWTDGDCSRRVVHGGSWFDPRRGLRSAFRIGVSSVGGDTDLGFRVARTLAH